VRLEFHKSTGPQRPIRFLKRARERFQPFLFVFCLIACIIVFGFWRLHGSLRLSAVSQETIHLAVQSRIFQHKSPSSLILSQMFWAIFVLCGCCCFSQNSLKIH
jgi:hypothetical protein